VAGASHERDADGTLVRWAVYPNIATAEAKGPAQVKGCRISLDYWGGVVVYVNGKEAARGHMSGGATNPEVVADDYPKDAYMHPLVTNFPGSDSNVVMKVRQACSVRAAWGPGNIVKTWKPSCAIIGRFWRSDGGTPKTD
jgi:hypothetical protein